MTAKNETPADTSAQTPADTPSITLQDLNIMLSLVNAACQRGAIKPEEMAITGALHDKLKKFLESSGALKAAETK